MKKTQLSLYDSPRQAGIIAVNFRDDDDELIGAELCSAEDDVLLISKKGQAIRFPASDAQLRPMGRATSGVTGMKFRDGDELLSLTRISRALMDTEGAEDQWYVFTVTDEGFGKRTAVSEYRQQGRGGLGIKAMKLNDSRGELVGGLVVRENDEVIAIKTSGQITRSAVNEVPVKGRDTMGVKFVGVNKGDSVAVIALNPESDAELEELVSGEETGDGSAVTSDGAVGTAVDSDPGDESGIVEGESATAAGSEQAESPDQAASDDQAGSTDGDGPSDGAESRTTADEDEPEE